MSHEFIPGRRCFLKANAKLISGTAIIAMAPVLLFKSEAEFVVDMDVNSMYPFPLFVTDGMLLVDTNKVRMNEIYGKIACQGQEEINDENGLCHGFL